MLEQMRIAPLVILLVDRAGIDPHAHRNLPRRHAVLAHRIAHAIGKPAEFPCLVVDEVAALVEPGVVGGLDRARRDLRMRREHRGQSCEGKRGEERKPQEAKHGVSCNDEGAAMPA